MKRLLLASGAAATLAAGCGGSGKSSASSDLATLLLKDGDLPGYTSAGRPQTATDPEEWAALNHTPSDARRLKALGFKAGARVDFRSASGSPGISLVERFASSASATREMAGQMADERNPTRFSVPGVPGAIGFEVGPAGSRGRNVVFVKGSTYYVDGYFLSDHAPGRASLVTAARRQYQAGR